MKICRKGHRRNDRETRCADCHKEAKASNYQLHRESLLRRLKQDRLDLIAYRALAKTSTESSK